MKVKEEYERAVREREEAGVKEAENDASVASLERQVCFVFGEGAKASFGVFEGRCGIDRFDRLQMAEIRRQEAIDQAALMDVVGKLCSGVGSYMKEVEAAMSAI